MEINQNRKKVCHEKNDYPKWVINQVLNKVAEEHKTSENNVSEETQVSPVTDLKCHLLVLPCQVQKGDFIIKSMKKRLKIFLPDNVKTDEAFQGKQLSSYFNIKQSLRINMIWFTLLTVLKKVIMLTMSGKRQDASLKG